MSYRIWSWYGGLFNPLFTMFGYSLHPVMSQCSLSLAQIQWPSNPTSTYVKTPILYNQNQTFSSLSENQIFTDSIHCYMITSLLRGIHQCKSHSINGVWYRSNYIMLISNYILGNSRFGTLLTWGGETQFIGVCNVLVHLLGISLCIKDY